MCMNCGCGKPEDRHGDEANITLSDLRAAGEANDQSLDETISNIQQAWQQQGEGGMSRSGMSESA